MEDLAEFSGENVLPISRAEIAEANRAQLDKLAARTYVQVENFYRIELAPSAIERAGRVKVSFIDENRRRNSRIIAYLHQIAPCQPPVRNQSAGSQQ